MRVWKWKFCPKIINSGGCGEYAEEGGGDGKSGRGGGGV